MKELSEIAKRQIKESYTKEAQPHISEAQGLGLAIAHHFEWDGLRILECMYEALEESNFHTINETVGKWIEELKAGG